jgi:recombination protein RecA
MLPDRGLPRGVVEIASPINERGALRGGATTIALATVCTAQTADTRAWCAWITPEDVPMLYAPAVVQAGVDLERLLVVRPPVAALARTAVKAAASGAFSIVIVDAFAGLGTKTAAVVVRKLALTAQELGTTIVLLTNARASRTVPWPVALRLEVERQPESLVVRITKDRRGRASCAQVLEWPLGDAVANVPRPKHLASAKPSRVGDAR